MTRPQDLYFTDSDEGAIGATLWWTFSPIARNDLDAKLAEKSLDQTFKLPKISPEVAMRRMMDSAKDVYLRPGQAQRFLVRPIRGKRHEWALVKECGTGQSHNEYVQYMHAKLVGDSPYISWDISPQMSDASTYLNQQYDKALDTLMADDLSQWLKGILRDRLDATLLRDAGGVWFVPKAKVPGLKILEEIFMPRLTLVRSGRTESFVINVLQSMREEAFKSMQEINEWYDQNTEYNDRNAKTRKGHETMLTELKSKVERYEKIVQRPMLDVHSFLLDLKNKISGTFFRAAAAAQGQSVAKGERVLELDDKPSQGPIEEPEIADARFKIVIEDTERPDHAPEANEDSEGRKVDIDE